MKKNKSLYLFVIFSILFSFSCTKEKVVYVGNSNIQLQSIITEKLTPSGYKVTLRWIDLDSATNTKYFSTLFDLNNQIPPFNDTISTRSLTIQNVPEAQPVALRIISNIKIDSTKLRFKITQGNVDITIFSKW